MDLYFAFTIPSLIVFYHFAICKRALLLGGSGNIAGM